MSGVSNNPNLTRREALAASAKLAAAGAVVAALGPFSVREAKAQGMGRIQPEETVEATMKRAFGGKPMGDGASIIKLEAPEIAENGAVVAVKAEGLNAQTPQKHIKKIHFVVDKNRRPLSASFSFAPDGAKPLVGTNLRLNSTTDIQAIAEMNDGSLVKVVKNVKVTVGGCGG
jgi:sulfur-oxidizing protein SoxY